MIDMLFDTKDSPSKTLYSGVFGGESLADGKDTSAVGAACFPLRPRDVVFGSEREVYWRCVESHVWKASVYSHTSSRESRCPDCYVETKDWLADSAGFCITGSDLPAADTNDGWNIDPCV